MRHEISLYGIYFPSLLLCAVIAGIVWFAVDWIIVRCDGWRLFWQPPLAKLSLFFVLIGIVAAITPDF